MERTKFPTKLNGLHNHQLEFFVIEAFKSSGFLIVNKTLIQKLGLLPAIVLSNYIDKYIYFRDHEKLQDGWFYLTHEQQMDQLNLSERMIVKCKNLLKEQGILLTKNQGLPAKEYYCINFINLANAFKDSIEILDPHVPGGLAPSLLGGLDPSLLGGQATYVPGGLLYKNKEIKKKETKYKETKINIFLADKLANIILSKKNMKFTTVQIQTWAKAINQLIESNEIPQERVEAALNWYEKHIGEPYVPVIESGKALQEKFIKLENAMQRDKFTTNGNKPVTGYREEGKVYREADFEM